MEIAKLKKDNERFKSAFYGLKELERAANERSSIHYKKLIELKKENKELIDDYEEVVDELKKENKQLKFDLNISKGKELRADQDIMSKLDQLDYLKKKNAEIKKECWPYKDKNNILKKEIMLKDNEIAKLKKKKEELKGKLWDAGDLGGSVGSDDDGSYSECEMCNITLYEETMGEYCKGFDFCCDCYKKHKEECKRCDDDE